MTITDCIKTYFHSLEIGSYEQIIRLFDQEAIIYSPLYGQIQAQPFYRDLFSITRNSKITLKDIYASVNDSFNAAALFLYEWTLRDGNPVNFECVDIFTFSQEIKIKQLKIIYDSYYVRGAFGVATTSK